MNRPLALLATFALGLGALTTTASAAALPGDAGLATTVTGEITVKSKGEKPTALVPYAKVRDGDQLVVADGASLEIVYFEGGRVETWQGPATVKIEGLEGHAAKGDGAVVETADDSLGAHLAVIPVILKQTEDERAGQTRVRGAHDDELALDEAEKAEVDAARQLYKDMRTQAADAEILPEMYLASVLLGYDLFDEGIEVLEGALERCPDCDAPRSLLDWARTSSKES